MCEHLRVLDTLVSIPEQLQTLCFLVPTTQQLMSALDSPASMFEWLLVALDLLLTAPDFQVLERGSGLGLEMKQVMVLVWQVLVLMVPVLQVLVSALFPRCLVTAALESKWLRVPLLA